MSHYSNLNANNPKFFIFGFHFGRFILCTDAEFCKQAFGLYLQSQKNMNSSKQPANICQYCSKVFGKKKSLSQHMKIRHKEANEEVTDEQIDFKAAVRNQSGLKLDPNLIISTSSSPANLSKPPQMRKREISQNMRESLEQQVGTPIYQGLKISMCKD